MATFLARKGSVQIRARRKSRGFGFALVIPLQLCPGNSPKFSPDTLTSFSLGLSLHPQCRLDAEELGAVTSSPSSSLQ